MSDPLLYEDELDAARDAVKHLGGAKVVGGMLWPDKSPESAARYLLDALNPTRAERLTPSQVLLLMRKAREVGFHGLTAFLLREAGYAPPVPINPETEAAVLTRQVDSLMGQAASLVSRLERLKGLDR